MARLSIIKKGEFFRSGLRGFPQLPTCCLATHLIGNLSATGGDGAVFLALILELRKPSKQHANQVSQTRSHRTDCQRSKSGPPP